MPSLVAYCTVTGTWLAASSVTSNSAVRPSSTVTSAMDSFGSSSSSVMVPSPVPSPIVAPTGLLSRTVKVSSTS